MRRALLGNAMPALMVALASAAVAWLGLYGYAWNDYDNEVRPAFQALLAGHLGRFLSLAPAYGGSLVERAPFAMVPGLWGGGPLAVYRAAAAPCLLAAALLALWLLLEMRRRGGSSLAKAVAVGVCVANPVTVAALEVGHPEELLGGCLCVFAILAASRQRPLAAGVLLGLAIANKEWALLALGPALLALAPGRRLALLAAAGGTAGAVLAPLLLVGSGGFAAGTRAVASTSSTIFQPWQLWWFLGSHGAPVHGLFGVAKPGYRTAPGWVGPLSHPLILLVGALVPIALALTRSPSIPGSTSLPRVLARARSAQLAESEALLALALPLLLRCLLDTWDTVYYPLPFLLVLLAWEVSRPRSDPPVLALACSALVWLSFTWLPQHVSADAQSALFLAWSLPLAVVLAARLRFPERAEGASRPQEMTVSSLGRLVRTS